MQEKVLLPRRESMLMKLFASVFFLFTIVSTRAATYYWVGGAGDWLTVSGTPHWSFSSGGAPVSLATPPPGNNDDVIFDNLSGFTAGALGNRVNFMNSTAVRSITVNANIAPDFYFPYPSQFFDVYGNATFQSGMTLTNFSCMLRFFFSPSNLNNVVNTNGNTFVNRWRLDAGTNVTPGTLTINGNFTHKNGFEINAALPNDKVVIAGNASYIMTGYNPYPIPTQGLDVMRGEIYFDAPFDASTGGSNYKFYISENGKLFSKANGSIPGLYNSGYVNLNYAGTNPTYTIGTVAIHTAPVTLTSTLDIQNSTLNILDSYDYGNGTASLYAFNGVGSVLNFKSSATSFACYNYNYNIVNLESSLLADFSFYGTRYNSNSVVSPNINALNIRRNATIIHQGSSPTFSVNCQNLKIDPGLTITMTTGAMRFNVSNLCDITGTCERPILFINTNFNFGAGVTLLSSNINSSGISATGTAAPYNAGAGSKVLSGGSSGWIFGSPWTARTLIWVGATPIPANISNQNTYARWSSSANWRDLAVDPGATGPGYSLGTYACPPTLKDSVIFPAGSYVLVDSVDLIYSSGVNWTGGGRIYASANINWEIYAGLTFHASTINDFGGTVRFKNNKTYECIIKTRNVSFRSGLVFDALDNSRNWRLTDGDLIALTSDPECSSGWGVSSTFSLRMRTGHLHTGTSVCSSIDSYKMRLFGLGASGGIMSWYGSDVEIKGGSSYIVYHLQDNSVLNCGISHLKLDLPLGSTQTSDLGNKTYFKVSVLSTAGLAPLFAQIVNVSPGLPTTTVPTIFEMVADANTQPCLSFAGNNTTPVRVKKLTVNSPNSYLGYWNPGPQVIATIDSLLMTGNVFINTNLKIRSFIKMAPSKSYVLGLSTNYIDLMAASSASSYSTCIGSATNYSGASADFNGSCSGVITIQNGRFIKNTSNPINVQYVNVVNNVIDVPGVGFNANGLLTGVTTGWTATVATPRKLRWKDPTVANNNSADWNNPLYWEQILPVYAPAPQCPPTKIDTIIFDANSFASGTTGQTFNIHAPLEVATMKWINVNNNPKMTGSAQVSIYASLELDNGMQQLNTSSFVLRGTPSVQFPTFNLKFEGKVLEAITFNGDANNTTWNLQDSMIVRYGTVWNRGTFNSNGFPLNSLTGGYLVQDLNTTDLKTLNIANSVLYVHPLSGQGFIVNHVGPNSNTNVISTNSTIYTSWGTGYTFRGGGYPYNKVMMRGGKMDVAVGDQFNFIDATVHGPAEFYGSSLIARRIRMNSNAFVLSAVNSVIDTLQMFGLNNRITTSNKFRKMFTLSPGKTLILGANEVQWFDNVCPVELIGTSTGNIQLYSTVSNTPAYMRKDSATVCADYIFIKDIWGIGNGNNPASGCFSYGNPLIPPAQTTLCAHPNPWIPSSCDTISDDGTACGAWSPIAPNRGRAAFTAGGAANPQSGIAGWDFRPYPPVPAQTLSSGTPAICIGDSVLLTITGIGKIPFYLDYTDSQGSTHAVYVTSTAQLTTYNTTTQAFTYQTYVHPTTSTTYFAGVVIVDRCFNATSPLGTGTLAVTVNPYPAITNAGLPIEICSGTTGSFVPTTSIPASVTWTSPSVAGITGHSTSGTTSISETLTNSNGTPTTITYTLTPSAAGCVGTPVTQDIVVNPLPNVVSGATQTLDCNTSSVNVSVSSSTPGVTYAWSGPSILGGGSTNSATVDAVGTYTCVVTNPTTGCTRNGSVSVVFAPDIVVPTITCPADISANTSAASCNATIVTTNPTIGDNCSVSTLRWTMTGATVASSPTTGINYVGTQTFNLGTTTVTYTAIDPTGNQSTCSFTVTVTDNVLPTITCPSDISTVTTAAGCSRSVLTSAPAFSDNCGVNRVTWSLTGATVANSAATGINMVGTQTFNLGVTTVTYTVVDNSGNSASCNYTVTVQDTIDPFLNCPANISAFTSAASCTASVNSPNPSVSDNCSLASLTWVITGATTASSPATGINNVGTRTYNLGVSTVTYTATDASGNVSTCFYTITVTDNVVPTISCPGNQSVNTNAGVCSATFTAPNPAINDNCSVSTLTYTITGATTGNSSATGINNIGSYTFNIGTSTVTYTVTDAAGNSATCSYNVIVTDAELPTITCPSNISANTSASSCDASVAVPNVTFGDNCSVAALTWTMTGATVAASPSSGINQVGTQTFNSGVTTIIYTVRDASNNTSTCSFTVTVTDATPPVAPALPDVTGQCSATAPIPVATDNCTGFVNGTTSDPLTYNSQGTFVIQWTFTDAAGNVTTANQTVIVDNSLPPTPPVLATIIAECSATVPVPVATTGCSGPISGTTSDPLVYNSQGTYTVTWTFDDGMGNVVTSTQTVIIDDITPPVVPSLSPVTAECSASLTAPTTTDNCSGTITGTTSNPVNYSTQGTFNVVWNFDDGNGNSTSAIQTVSIADITNPTFTNCPTDIAVSNDLGDCGAVVSWTPPTASDNCSGYVVTSSHNPGDYFNLGTTTVTYTITDVGGNSATCSFDVVVTDNEAPVINACPSDISVANDPMICGAVVMWVIPVPNDNCPGVTFTSTHNSGDLFPTGTTTVTYTATDAYGNTSICTFDVTVTDTEAPLFANCPNDITVNNDPGICGAVVSWPPMTATDNCSAVTIVGSHNPGDQFPVGTTTVTYTATDTDGNGVSCVFTVTVIDNENPVLSGIADVSVCEGSPATWNVTATDNCAVQSLTSNYNSGDVFPLGNTWVVYTAVDVAGNVVVDSFAVNVFASSAILVQSQPNTDICVGDDVSLMVMNPVAGATYSWEFGSTPIGIGSPFDLLNVQITQTGTYNITGNLPGGCVAYGSVTIGVDFCELLIPEAVTPNADGDNDTWYIENLENYANSKVQIVNRWGVVVFESDDYQNDWDGTSYSSLNVGGNQLPEGTFYYVLQIGGDPSSKFYGKIFTGYIYLKR